MYRLRVVCIDVPWGSLDTFGYGQPSDNIFNTQGYWGVNFTQVFPAPGDSINTLVYDSQQFIQAHQFPVDGHCVDSYGYYHGAGYFAGDYNAAQNSMAQLFPDMGVEFARADLNNLVIDYNLWRFLKSQSQNQNQPNQNTGGYPFKW